MAERSEVGVGEAQNTGRVWWCWFPVSPHPSPAKRRFFLPLEGKEEEAAGISKPSHRNRDRTPLEGRQSYGLLGGGVANPRVGRRVPVLSFGTR